MSHKSINIDDKHRLVGAVHHFESPHYNQRPDSTAISLLMIHCISMPPGNFGGDDIHHLFMGTLDVNADPYYQTIPDLGVSAHVLIRRDGEVIQYVSFDKRAWHAGQSEFEGVPNCNDYAIGIELEGGEDVPYDAIQYEKLYEVTQTLMKKYPDISCDRIVRHSDVAPGRKTDPGASFEWENYRKNISENVE